MKQLLFILALCALPAIGAAENIDVTPLAWDFGDVLVGDSATQTFTITGAGTYFDSEVGLIEVRDDPAGAFALEWPLDPPLPLFLPPGESIYYDVTFTPPSVGDFSAVLYIPSSDLRWPDLDVPLTGHASGAVPEPGTLAIWSVLTVGGIGFGWRRRRRGRT